MHMVAKHRFGSNIELRPRLQADSNNGQSYGGLHLLFFEDTEGLRGGRCFPRRVESSSIFPADPPPFGEYDGISSVTK